MGNFTLASLFDLVIVSFTVYYSVSGINAKQSLENSIWGLVFVWQKQYALVEFGCSSGGKS